VERRSHKIPNPKHQNTIESQIPIANDQNRFESSNLSHFDFSGIDEKTFSIFEFRIWVIVICLCFVICNLEFPSTSVSPRRFKSACCPLSAACCLLPTDSWLLYSGLTHFP